MLVPKIVVSLLAVSALLTPVTGAAASGKATTINASGITLTLNYDHTASVTSLIVHGQQVIGSADGIFTCVRVGGTVYSSLHLQTAPVLTRSGNTTTIDRIRYGDQALTISEKWVFVTEGSSIRWRIDRTFSTSVRADDAETPVFHFDNMGIWEGAYQGYGGLAWFYLFNEKGETYGVHTQSSHFWNSKSGDGLTIAVDAPGRKVAMTYSRAMDDRLDFSVNISDSDRVYRLDSGTNRRRFIRKATDVWSSYTEPGGKSTQTITLSYFDVNKRYGRGKFVGVDGTQVSAVLNTIARIGVIDSLHFGGNSWHTPYGPICLHEQYIAQLGLAIDDPDYLKGYQSCLDFYRDHAIRPDGRVFARWAYNNEDMMAGQGNADGFYEAQWGFLMDANPDLVTNVAELYDLTGDKGWVKTHQLSCERALDWILRRDRNGNGLVEMMTNSEKEQRSSDWIDIIWASYENAFVNAKLYHALVQWAAIERQLNNTAKAREYERFAARLKDRFNKPTTEGGFWDEEKGCYVHWLDNDGTVHGRNMVTPVNFMAIAYGICDDSDRRKRILDAIENQMQHEGLFFWPLAMTSYAPGEGKDWQFPFPSYENGDLFLSWGSVGVRAYAAYKPSLALKYVKNVLNQYSKDGLAFQRYGRLKQDGLGDDILSGNSLAIVGLYQAIYGINPLYNRLYLDPHMTGELSGTKLSYDFRGERLTIGLDSDAYSVSNGRFTIQSAKSFGFMATKDRLSYFNGNGASSSMDVATEEPCTIDIKSWGVEKVEWVQTGSRLSVKPLIYQLHQLMPDAIYRLSIDGKTGKRVNTDARGNLVITEAAHSRRFALEQKPSMEQAFLNPPDSCRPGVYWYFMDGNMSKSGMTEDLESMSKAGIGNVLFLEVNVGVPRGPINYLGPQWQELFKHALDECERLGIRMTLGIGPGWSGSGGPWVRPEQSMQHLVSSTIQVNGSSNGKIQLPLPLPRTPYFGEDALTPELKARRDSFYTDVAVLAFPTPAEHGAIDQIDDKALFYREPFSSTPGVRPFLRSFSDYADTAAADIPKDRILDLSAKLLARGTLDWTVPAGNWTIMRFGSRNNGAVTRPAPLQGLGFEADKFDTVALDEHLDAYVGNILRYNHLPHAAGSGGLKMLHMDSWEMGAQNWTGRFRQEFTRRRGYDPLPFYPVYAGHVVGSRALSERFLWDLRQTAQELVLDYHARQVKKYAHRYGLGLSIEPYDMNPTADLELGSVADIPMGEFWSKGYGFNTAFSIIEAASLGHVRGIPVVQSEAFTADGNEAWKQYPGSMKNQGDWALAAGINRFFYHTFAHKPLPDSLRPGMNMGPYGVHWDRMQTWWPMVGAYHRYIARCQYLLQQGRTVADILYLTPEGAPQVFQPPLTAVGRDSLLPDRKGYNFDGCAPGELYLAKVKDGRIVFPGGASYRLLVLPAVETMTPALLEKIKTLVDAGAMVVGPLPKKSPSLSGFPRCDQQVQALSATLRGRVIAVADVSIEHSDSLYPPYEVTASLLNKMGVNEDFLSAAPLRYTHRRTTDKDIYFVSNKTNGPVQSDCIFNVAMGVPELWDPLTGRTTLLPEFRVYEGRTTIPLQFEAYQSFFIVFRQASSAVSAGARNFPRLTNVATLAGPWRVSFDPTWGGPAAVTFDSLTDWSLSSDQGIKYYSGIAIYRKSFDLADTGRLYIDCGKVQNMARVRLNGHDLGVVWTAPWRVDITGIVKARDNQLEISVANLWPNRLIGDDQRQDGHRFTYTTYDPYSKDTPLLESGLLGPVVIKKEVY